MRSEHISLGTEHQLRLQELIMAEKDEERGKALDTLLSLQQTPRGFQGDGGVAGDDRLLDPPLHESPELEELASRRSARATRRATTSRSSSKSTSGCGS